MTLRAGVIGLGMMGRNHVRVLRDLEDVELVGVADVNGDRYRAATGLPVFGTPEGLVDAGLDICVVVAPTDQHEQIGVFLAEAGVHALVEKPLADDLAAADRLSQAFNRAGLVGCVGHIERYNPALRAARSRLEQGDLGEIFQIATRRQGPFPNRIRDVGVIKDLATHDVDLTTWVAGSPYRSVSARTAHKTGREHEDLVAATGALEDGTVTNHLVNWLTPTKERVTWITGERGCFAADMLTADLTFFANGDVPTEWAAISQFRGVSEGDMTRFAILKPEPLAVELASFRDAVLGRDAEVVTMHEGRDVVAIAEAMVTSAAEGRTVQIDQGSRA
jgi:UDP-N-acetylglucosamine 3-dehydrogenase